MGRNYKRPPIQEAVIDLKFDPILQLDMSRLIKKFEQDYPLPPEHLMRAEPIRVESDGALLQQFVEGTRMTGADGDKIIILSADSLTTSKIAPYKGWNDFFNTFERNLTEFRKIAENKPLKRIGVRYINRIDIPSDGHQFLNVDDYFNASYRAPNNEGIGHCSGFSLTTNWKHPKSSWIANLVVQAISPALIDHFSFFLDIDVILLQDFPTSDRQLFASLNVAREFKNELFEASIKDSLRELFDR